MSYQYANRRQRREVLLLPRTGRLWRAYRGVKTLTRKVDTSIDSFARMVSAMGDYVMCRDAMSLANLKDPEVK